MSYSRIHPGWWSAVLVAVIVGFMSLCSALFAGAMHVYVPVTLTSERTGLVMETGAKVKMRGVHVGRVAGIETGSGHLRIKLELFPSQVKYIPANSQAQIRASTVFGAKYVDLIYPDDPSAEYISAGAVLKSRNVSTEVNTVFQNLTEVLDKLDPPKLNAILTALAEAVGGRGQRIGEATSAVNHVLSAINPRMGILGQDWLSIKRASDAYSVAAQDILGILRSAGATSTTVTTRAADLELLLLNTIGFAQAGTDLIGPNRTNLVDAVNVLEPTTNLLMKYDPSYTCLLMGAKWALDNGGYEVAGGNGRTAVIDGTLLFADDPYRYPDHLPIVAAKGGPGGKPGCGSLPDASKNFPVRQLITNTGWGTGLDLRPNPGISEVCWANYLPVTRAVPEPPSIRRCLPGPAIGPVPYPGAPPYGAPLYGPNGETLYPLPPGAPAPPPATPASAAETHVTETPPAVP